jgi:opacity protein-like surface antigen
MRKFLLATTALAVLSGIGAASAADLPSRKGPPIAPAYIPAFTWTGFYVGLNAGVGWANNNNNNNLPLGAIPVSGFVSSGNSNNAGFVGGAQAGYNYQFGVGQGVVIGAETDFQFAASATIGTTRFPSPWRSSPAPLSPPARVTAAAIISARCAGASAMAGIESSSTAPAVSPMATSGATVTTA